MTRRSILSRISIIGLICLIVTATLPMEAQAILVAKNAKKYKITIHNASSDTVIKKGKNISDKKILWFSRVVVVIVFFLSL